MIVRSSWCEPGASEWLRRTSTLSPTSGARTYPPVGVPGGPASASQAPWIGAHSFQSAVSAAAGPITAATKVRARLLRIHLGYILSGYSVSRPIAPDIVPGAALDLVGS